MTAPAGGFWHVNDSIANPNTRVQRFWRHMATCPECDADVDIDEVDADVGDEVSCSECGSNLVVSGTDPLELDFASDEDEDDEDDDELEDDEDELEDDEDEDDADDGDIDE